MQLPKLNNVSVKTQSVVFRRKPAAKRRTALGRLTVADNQSENWLGLQCDGADREGCVKNACA